MTNEERQRLHDSVRTFGTVVSTVSSVRHSNNNDVPDNGDVRPNSAPATRIIEAVKSLKSNIPRKPKKVVEVKLDPHGGTKRNKAAAKLKKKTKQKNRRK
jgi:hypothetical protein